MRTICRLRRPGARSSRSRLSCGLSGLVAFLSLSLSGCLTIDRLVSEEPQVYGDTRSHIDHDPVDYNLERSLLWGLELAAPPVLYAVWGADLLFCLIVDTPTLPLTVTH